jgi:hypothetical protein
MRYGPIDLMYFLAQYPKVWITGLIAWIILGAAAAWGRSAYKKRKERLQEKEIEPEVKRVYQALLRKRGLSATLPPLPSLPRGHQWQEGAADAYMKDYLAKYPLPHRSKRSKIKPGK